MKISSYYLGSDAKNIKFKSIIAVLDDNEWAYYDGKLLEYCSIKKFKKQVIETKENETHADCRISGRYPIYHVSQK